MYDRMLEFPLTPATGSDPRRGSHRGPGVPAAVPPPPELVSTLEIRLVSTRVNSVRNNGPELLSDRLPDDQVALPIQLDLLSSGRTTSTRRGPGLRRCTRRRPRRVLAVFAAAGHGAGGGIGAPDLLAATTAATAAGFDVGLVEQLYRVAGRRARPRLGTSTRGLAGGRRRDEGPGPPAGAGGRSLGVGGLPHGRFATGAPPACCAWRLRAAPAGEAGADPAARSWTAPGCRCSSCRPADRFGVLGDGLQRQVVLLDGESIMGLAASTPR
ncbi:hypothetical protein HBB16_07295 [Pseudonocardia sp. MCCB 268]|nr:hypothetical protein [Pseudonocardia cytotoxica]